MVNGGEEDQVDQVQDHRQMCKYSTDCYQKNPMHQEKFKHPPKEEESQKRPKESEETEETEEEEQPKAKKVKSEEDDLKAKIEEAYKLKMPDDFFHFWDFCKERNREKPEEALVDTLGLKLVGPFDFISNPEKMQKVEEKKDFLVHWRFYFDPPEFQTLLASTNSNFHVGYFRDDPKDLPVFTASNDPDDNCKMTLIGDNLFGCV